MVTHTNPEAELLSRLALFLTPLPGDPLDTAAARWLGRDVFADTETPRNGVGDVSAHEHVRLTRSAPVAAAFTVP